MQRRRCIFSPHSERTSNRTAIAVGSQTIQTKKISIGVCNAIWKNIKQEKLHLLNQDIYVSDFIAKSRIFVYNKIGELLISFGNLFAPYEIDLNPHNNDLLVADDRGLSIFDQRGNFKKLLGKQDFLFG